MLESQDAKVIRPDAVIYRKRETRHQISPHSSLEDAPPLRSIKNRTHGELRRIKKLTAKRGNPLLVKPSGLDQFRFGIGVINQAHPTARRAASITSSWVRPCTAPEESEKKLAELGFSLAAVNDFIAKGTPTQELQAILDNLAARGLRDFVKVDYQVIRGLAYYTGVVFEAFDRKGELRAIAGGGRYNGLVKLISNGKVDLPALGFGMGDVVLLELLKARGLLPKFDAPMFVYALVEDETLRPATLKLVHDLRAAGHAVEYPLTPAKPDKQFKRAQELKVAFTARLDSSDYVRLRNLKTREEIVAGVNDVGNHLRCTP